MARGFLSGAIWGTVLSVGGLGVASVLLPTQTLAPRPVMEAADPAPVGEPVATADTETEPTAPVAETESATATEMPEADAPSAPAVSVEPSETSVDIATTTPEDRATESAESDGSASLVDTVEEPARRSADVAPVAPSDDAPVLETPEVAEAVPPAETDTMAAPAPTLDTGDEIAALDAPTPGDGPAPQAVPGTDTAPGLQAAPSLNAPQSEAGLSVSTEPAQPPQPDVPVVETPLVPDPEPEPDTAPAPETASEPGTDDAATAATDTPDPAAAPEQSERPTVRRLVPSEGADAEGDAGQSTTAALRPSIGTPAASLTDRNPGNSARLPSIGGAADDASDTPAAAPEADSSLPPLQRFAAEVSSDPSLPKMSIVMIDDGAGPLGPDTLDGFPFPVTFALDPAQEGAADRMAAYRTLGYEVAVLVSLPQAAQPSDVEQILAGALAAVPEAVALIEAPGSALQSDRSITEQAAEFVAESGHGLVFLPNGLNTAQAIAQREAVPALSILRDFDGDGQDARTKRRFLDGAAFRARQDGAVAMLGRLTPDTLSALVLWSLQDRASSVAMVPVSTLLLDQ